MEEIGAELSISRKDISSIRWERLRQKWLLPVIGSIFAMGATVIGYLEGRDDTRYIDGKPQGYPYSMTIAEAAQPIISFIPFAFMIPILGTLSYRSIGDARRRRIINMGILIILLIIGLLGSVLAYEYARPEVRKDMMMGQGTKYGVWHQ